VTPVAEEYKVRIAMHPEDPPGLTLGNVPRCIFSSFDGYKIMKALREEDADCFIIADHWPDMEGGPMTGCAFTMGYIKALLERANEEVGG